MYISSLPMWQSTSEIKDALLGLFFPARAYCKMGVGVFLILSYFLFLFSIWAWAMGVACVINGFCKLLFIPIIVSATKGSPYVSAKLVCTSTPFLHSTPGLGNALHTLF